MKRLLSLFDYSGEWARPFAVNGWDAWPWDIKAGNDVLTFDSCERALNILEDVDGIIAAVPCTDYAASGAWTWKAKDADGRTELSNRLTETTLQLVDLFAATDPDWYEEGGEFFWAIENPVGRINKIFPELGAGYFFNPCDFAGYLNLTDADHNELDRLRRKDGKLSREEAEFVVECNAYTKKTGLWGDFNREMEKRPIEPVRCNKQGSPIMSLGGKSQRTKELRSNTPAGFAQAFYEAQQGYSGSPFWEFASRNLKPKKARA